MHRNRKLSLCWGVLLGLSAGALAGECSRPIRVPLAPVGLSVIAGEGGISGVYPELLKQVETQHRCHFVFELVPRSRLERLAELGQADIMMPAAESEKRDLHGEFIPVVKVKPSFVWMRREHPALRSTKALRATPTLRLAVVRGFDYGQTYRELLQTLTQQHRLVLEEDAVGVARSLAQGMADLSLMPSALMLGALQVDRQYGTLAQRLSFDEIDDMPWRNAGVYLSRDSLTAADRRLLRGAIEDLVNSGEAWRGFLRFYPKRAVEASFRPRERTP